MQATGFTEGIFKMRPAARLIHTIGSDLIGDSYAALVELVKNAYDADASKVSIEFKFTKIEDTPILFITVEDDGHGMDIDTVVNKWLVPATNDKLARKISRFKGRTLQGRKGIGRFAASLLGQEMTLQTVDSAGEQATVIIDWEKFKSDTFLDNVEILIETGKTDKKSGTLIKILAKDTEEDNKLSIWDRTSIEKLFSELRKLISPFKKYENDFNITLAFIDCPVAEYNNKTFEVERYPIIELYDYRISGKIDSSGNATLLYENSVLKVKQTEEIKTHYNLELGGKYCGELDIDFRVFDRDPDAISNLINKGLVDPISQKFAGKNQAKAMLNEVYGVNIYKNLFRIRPYGNQGIDWLDLDKERIQNFTLKISNNQIVGFITIQSEEQSNLKEKSARDGLKEDEYYFGLKELSQKALRELELRRLAFREKTLKGRKGKTTIQENVKKLFNFSDLTQNIESKLLQFNVGHNTILQIKNILKEEETKKEELLQEIEKTIAIYQGQATLGKIVTFVLHEGRKPLQFLNTETNVIERYINHFKKTKDENLLSELDTSLNGFRKNTKIISDLFKRINPLASQRKSNRKMFKIADAIADSSQIFKEEFLSNNIQLKVNCSEEIMVYGWSEDLFAAITNLLENSLYWLSLSKENEKTINIDASETEDQILIDYRDNGPGLSADEIETEIIFEPGYTKKINGTGLGLAISGEAIQRLNGNLIARKSNNGAYFQIEINKK